ncbi:MAG: hypothetical protein V3575_06220 [Candidatus Absconditabacteria bacterium]
MYTAIVYFSKSGNNEYLAHKFYDKFSEKSNSKIFEIKAKGNINGFGFFWILMNSILGKGVSIDFDFSKLEGVDRLVLFTPMWMGKLPSPIIKFISQISSSIKLGVISVSGGGESKTTLESQIESILGAKPDLYKHFYMSNLVEDKNRIETKELVKIKLNDENYQLISKDLEAIIKDL